MKNSKKIVAAAVTAVLLSSAAQANGIGSQNSRASEECLMQFKTPWLAFMYIPCIARQMF